MGGKGIARRCLPFRKSPPSWVQISTNDLCDQIVKLAKKGATPSQIGVTLRDSHGIPQVKGVTGSKILRILRSSALTAMPSSALFALRAVSTDSPVTTVTLRCSAPLGDTFPKGPTLSSERLR